MKLLKSIIEEDLRKWFGKGKTGSSGGGGWDRYGSDGQKLGKCGDGKDGGAYAACLSSEKAAKLGPKGRASFVNRKRAAQKKAGDAKKGGEQSKGQKPTLVKTKANEMKINLKQFGKLNEAKFKSPDYIISTTPASNISPIRLAHADVAIGLKMADILKNYTLGVRHYKLVHANGKVALKLTPEGKTAVRVRTENDPKYLQLIQKTVNDVIKDYTSKIKENVKLKLTLEQKIKLFLEKNVPNDPQKWSYATSQAKKKFDVYPSAYANGWASKKYKELGGTWKKEK